MYEGKCESDKRSMTFQNSWCSTDLGFYIIYTVCIYNFFNDKQRCR